MAQQVTLFEQKAIDVLDYDFDFYAVLRPGGIGTDKIESTSIAISPATTPALRTLSVTFTDTVVKVFCRDGVAGTSYIVGVTIESVEGRVKTLELKLKIV